MSTINQPTTNGAMSLRELAGAADVTMGTVYAWNAKGICSAPGLMEALNPREDESHGSTEEVPGGASGASGPTRG
ncbi:hypothetical protein, partial [Curtobacterium sp. MCPF17_031]|uniref:hypothetical protein n=1 Tax=Curtobacterium sp. MCPF17_031 TaxID=2175653 RepID=UPI001C652B5F